MAEREVGKMVRMNLGNGSLKQVAKACEIILFHKMKV